MRNFLALILVLLFVTPACAIKVGNLEVENVVTLNKSDLDCSGNDNSGKITAGSDGVLVCADDVSTAGDPQSGAPTDATYITYTTNGDLSAEVALSQFGAGNLYWNGSALSVNDVVLESELDTIAELDTQISDATMLGTVDEDDMASDSATLTPTQQSVKAYVDGGMGDGWTRPYTFSGANGDDDDLVISHLPFAVTYTSVGISCEGTCSELATFSFKDNESNALTINTITISTPASNTVSYATITAGGSFSAGEKLLGSVTNDPTQTSNNYKVVFTYDR